MRLTWWRTYHQPLESDEICVLFGGEEEPATMWVGFPLGDPEVRKAIEAKDFFILQMLADVARDWRDWWTSEELRRLCAGETEAG